ncbi:hypothetical protein Vadar_019893 [Vaccinium darrowii]|uniref:Uncharacterized protein n=1 Tax=Vaccinium darrowii TaxID=229202 RepID=A0ACB7YF39_9ERIC|nr:hypothetical protein Vadar_019893 [Vaccinium darrowii]
MLVGFSNVTVETVYVWNSRCAVRIMMSPGRGGMPMATTTAATTMNLFPLPDKSVAVSGISTRNPAPMSRNLSSMDLFPLQSGFGPNISNEILRIGV